MLITDPLNDFYLALSNKRVIVILNDSVDSMCTWLIVRHLFISENVVYSVCTVRTVDQLIRELKYREMSEAQECSILCINCAGCLDVLSLLDSNYSETVFILENCRPFHLSNVLSSDKVKLVVNYEEIRTEHGSIPWNVLNETDDTDIEESEAIIEYYRASYHPYPSAIVAYQIAIMASRESRTLLWAAVVALSDLYANGLISRRLYLSHCAAMETHLRRLSRPIGTEPINLPRLRYQSDCLNGYFLSKWTIADFFRKSINMQCIFRMWEERGRRRFNEFLGELGISIQNSKMQYELVGSAVRQSLTLIRNRQYMRKYGYTDDTIFLPVFCLEYEHTLKITAMDFALCLQALVIDSETVDFGSSSLLNCTKCFLWHEPAMLNHAVERAKRFLTNVVETVQNLIDASLVISYGGIYYITLNQETRVQFKFMSINALRTLAMHIVQNRKHASRSSHSVNFPLILSIPHGETNSIFFGSMKCDETDLNSFFSLFEQAAADINIEIQFPYFDRSAIIIKNGDRLKLIERLSKLMRPKGAASQSRFT